MPHTDRLQGLHKMTECMKESCVMEDALSHIAQLVYDTFACRTVAVVLWDDMENALKVKIGRGLSAGFIKHFRRRVGVESVGEILWLKKSLHFDTIDTDSAYYRDLKLENDFSSLMACPITAGHRAMGYIHCDSEQENRFTEEDLRFLDILASLASLAIERDSLYSQIKELRQHDTELGILKYDAFFDLVQREIDRSLLCGGEFSLMLLDLDNYAAYRNMHGYIEGVQLMRDVANIVKERLRKFDFIAKHGPDEIIVCYPATDLEKTREIAEEIRQEIEGRSFRNPTPKITASIGVTCFGENNPTMHRMMTALGNALIKAQRAGRNKVVALREY
jgi:diguanylate cyclase (GGDEF)-like protein